MPIGIERERGGTAKDRAVGMKWLTLGGEGCSRDAPLTLQVDPAIELISLTIPNFYTALIFLLVATGFTVVYIIPPVLHVIEEKFAPMRAPRCCRCQCFLDTRWRALAPAKN